MRDSIWIPLRRCHSEGASQKVPLKRCLWRRGLAYALRHFGAAALKPTAMMLVPLIVGRGAMWGEGFGSVAVP